MDVRRLLKFAFLFLFNVESITEGEKLENRQVAFDINNFLNSQNCLGYSTHYLTKNWLEICEWLKRNERNRTKSTKSETASSKTLQSEHHTIAVEEQKVEISDSKENEVESVERTTVKSMVESATSNDFYNTCSTEADEAINFRTKIYMNEENEDLAFKVAYETSPTENLKYIGTEQAPSNKSDQSSLFEQKRCESAENINLFEDNSIKNSKEWDSSNENKISKTSITIPVPTQISSSKYNTEQKFSAPLPPITIYKTEITAPLPTSTIISIASSENINESSSTAHIENQESNIFATESFPTDIQTTQQEKDCTMELIIAESSCTSNLSNEQPPENLNSAEKISSADKNNDEGSNDTKDPIISNSLIPSNANEQSKEPSLVEIDISSKLNHKQNTSTDDQKPEELMEANIYRSGNLNSEQAAMPSPNPVPSIYVTAEKTDFEEKIDSFSPNGECQNSKSDEISDIAPDLLTQTAAAEPEISNTVSPLDPKQSIQIPDSPNNEASRENLDSLEIVYPQMNIEQQITPVETLTSPIFVNIVQNNLKTNDSIPSSSSSSEEKLEPIPLPGEPQPSAIDDETISFSSAKPISSSDTICELLDFVPASVKNITVNLKNIEDSRHRTRVRLEHFDSNAGFFNANPRLGLHLFFWFFRSSNHCHEVPLIVWLQGEPGWSSLYGLFEEHGPYYVDETENGEITLKLREFTWVKEFNVLYLDHSAGCGFSMATSQTPYRPTFDNVGKNVYYALYQFFKVFFEFQSNDLYLAGSYGGAKYLPVIAHVIHSKNLFSDLHMNLKGLMIGGPYIDAASMVSYSNILHSNGLIDEKKQKEMEMNQYYITSLINANKYKQAIERMKKHIYYEIERADYQKFYDVRYPKPRDGKYMFETYMPKVVQSDIFKTVIKINEVRFQTNSNILIEEIMCSVEYLMPQLLANYKILYYNGQFDLMAPYSMTAHYISRMHWQSADSFYCNSLNNWYVTDNGYPIGYWKNTKNITHVMIRDAGHTVGTTNSESLYHLLKWFVQDKFEMEGKKECEC